MNCMNSGDGLTTRRKTKTKETAKLENTGQVSRFMYKQHRKTITGLKTNKRTRFMK